MSRKETPLNFTTTETDAAKQEASGLGGAGDETINLGGDELNTLTQTRKPATDDNIVAAIRHASAENFWDELRDLKHTCEETMTSEGWLKKNARDYPTDETARPYSDLWYAGMIAKNCHMLLNHWTKRDEVSKVQLARIMAIGDLTCDWDWRSRYKDIIVKKINQNQQNGDNAKKAGAASTRRKTEQYATLRALVSEELPGFLNQSDKKKLGRAKLLARKHDASSPEDRLFHRSNVLMSNSWFEDWLTDFYINIKDV